MTTLREQWAQELATLNREIEEIRARGERIHFGPRVMRAWSLERILGLRDTRGRTTRTNR